MVSADCSLQGWVARRPLLEIGCWGGGLTLRGVSGLSYRQW